MGNVSTVNYVRAAADEKGKSDRMSGTLRSMGTLSRRSGASSKKSSQADLGTADLHRFSGEEVRWLNAFWSARFPKPPKFADVLKAFPQWGEHTKLLQELFRVMDRKKNGVLEMEEFVLACSIVGRSVLESKLQYLFILFDDDEDRIIERAHTIEMVGHIGQFMMRDEALANAYFRADRISDLFLKGDTLTMERFTKRALTLDCMDACTRVLDTIFGPVVEEMENQLGLATLFGRPLGYILYRERSLSIPEVLIEVLPHLVETRDPEKVDISTLLGRRLDDKDVLQFISRLELCLAEKKKMSHLRTNLESQGDKSVVMAVVKRFLNELLEPVFHFAMFSEITALNLKEGNVVEKLDAIVNQLARSHYLLLASLCSFIRDLSARESNPSDACDRLCVLLAPLVIRPKVPEDSSKAVTSIRASARFLIALVTQFNFQRGQDKPRTPGDPAADQQRALMQRIHDAKREGEEVRAELETTRQKLAALTSENAALNEKLTMQISAATKMATHVAELRSQLTELRKEQQLPPGSTTHLAVPSSLVSSQASESSSPLTSRHDADVKLSQPSRAVAPGGLAKFELSKDVFLDPPFPSDCTILTVEVQSASGLLVARDGKCEPYAKIVVRHVRDKKKRVCVTPTLSGRNPSWNFKFNVGFSNSHSLSEFHVDVSLFNHDKFGRDAFIGCIQQPASELGQDGWIEDWYPLKQKKPEDKVAGELKIAIYVGLQRPDSVGETGGTAAPFSAMPKPVRNGETDAKLLKNVDGMRPLVLREQYQDDLPNDADHLVLDRSTGTLLAVNRQKLFELLTNQARLNRDPEFLVDVLLTLGTWTEPMDFLTSLLTRYSGPSPQARSDVIQRFEVNGANIRWCVFKVLYEWINNPLLGQEFFWAPMLREGLMTFANDSDLSLKDLNLVGNSAAVRMRSSSRSSALAGTVRGGKQRRMESVFELPVDSVAAMLTVIEFELMERIQLSEFHGQAWNKDGKDKKSPNVLAYIAWFNRVSHWVATQIIQQAGPIERAAGINRFIEIGTALNTLNNFNGVIEILSALHSSAISRLKETWALVPARSRGLLEDLDQLMNTDGNFRYYRMLIEKTPPPYLPYLGLFLTDLTFVDDANLTEVGKGEKGAKMLNFEKLFMLARAYRTFRRAISKPYRLVEVKSVIQLLRGIEGFDESELYRMSKLREPPAGSQPQGQASAKVAKSTSKLIHQMTSSMLARQNLDVKLDSFEAEDWLQLEGTDGVTIEKHKQGHVLMDENKPLTHMFRVKSGSLRICRDDGTLAWMATEGSLFGELSLLSPSRPSKLRAVVVSEFAEILLIPRIVVHAAYHADAEMARKLYGEVAQSQARHLFEMPMMPKRVKSDVGEAVDNVLVKKWDVSWDTKHVNGGDFAVLGTLQLRKTCLVFSSNMLGFLTQVQIPLWVQLEVEVDGNAGVIRWTNTKTQLDDSTKFRCLTGFADTESCLSMIKEMASSADKTPPSLPSQSDLHSTSLHLLKDPFALSNEDWGSLLQGAKRQVFKKDDVIMKQGESYQRMYQIVRGIVRVEKIFDGTPKVLGSMQCSDTFGDISFLTGSPASATCVSDSEECELTILEGTYANMLFSMRPDLAGRFYKFVAMLITARIEKRLDE